MFLAECGIEAMLHFFVKCRSIISPRGPKDAKKEKNYYYKMYKNIHTHQAPVVQTLDNAIHRINHYPADKYYRNQLRYLLDRDLSGG